MPFRYPNTAHVRKHGPDGYATYEGYRPWLRDEFCFRCVYCLVREQFIRKLGVFDLDHAFPQADYPAKALDYDNLVYSCHRCNLSKGTTNLPDPLTTLAGGDLVVDEATGKISGGSPDALRIIEKLGLNSPENCDYRRMWIDIVACSRKKNSRLYKTILGYPAELPDLSRLLPPNGNKRPNGVAESYHAKRERGELDECY